MASKYLGNLSIVEYEELRNELWYIQNGKCFILDELIDLILHKDDLDIDHVTPYSYGGKFDKSVQRHLGNAIYKDRVIKYQKERGLDEDNFDFSERNLLEHVRSEAREMKRYIMELPPPVDNDSKGTNKNFFFHSSPEYVTLMHRGYRGFKM